MRRVAACPAPGARRPHRSPIKPERSAETVSGQLSAGRSLTRRNRKPRQRRQEKCSRRARCWRPGQCAESILQEPRCDGGSGQIYQPWKSRSLHFSRRASKTAIRAASPRHADPAPGGRVQNAPASRRAQLHAAYTLKLRCSAAWRKFRKSDPVTGRRQQQTDNS